MFVVVSNIMKKSLLPVGIVAIILLAVIAFNSSLFKNSKSGHTSIAYRDGQYSGSVNSAYYGNVQVQVSIIKGKIANVVYLKYPNSDSTSVYIAKGVLPYLKKEVLKTQSAHINIITGATFTSQAFIKSLAAALNKA
jgi:uncharacterized protein with FMN-binding domain